MKHLAKQLLTLVAPGLGSDSGSQREAWFKSS